ncbi:MAG TPA: SufS family cysteine desulfurase [Candidatus Azoamicus sp.]
MKIIDINEFKRNFPILDIKVNGNDLAYLDNAAITQVPECVITSLVEYYSKYNANVHRGAYYLSELSTEKYENVREKLNKFLNGEDCKNFIFVRSTTEAINLVSNSYLRSILQSGDEILITQMEHHSNIIPWYMLCKEFNVTLKVIPMLTDGSIDYSKIEFLLTSKTKILSVTHVSNAIGTINDIKRIISLAHSFNVPVLIDGAQSFSHCKVDLKDLDCDFYVFSSHKMHGPNGVGFLYAKSFLLDSMAPYQSGGDMIKSVSFSDVIWNDVPYKFEAGTPSIANIIAFGATLDFFDQYDLNSLFLYKKKLFNYLIDKLLNISYVKIIGTPENNSSIISFLLDGIHPHDFSTIANHYGVAVRTGHHCCMPIMNFYNISSSIRVSLSFYNTLSDIDVLIKSIFEARKIFS